MITKNSKLGELIECVPNKPKYRRIYEERPDILVNIVETARRNGQWKLAAAANRISDRTVSFWLEQGEVEVEAYENNNDVELTILGDFWYALKQAQALHAMGVIDDLHTLSDDTDHPEYKNYKLWIIENLIEGKPYARFMRTENKESKNVTVTVKYVTGEEWRTGNRQIEADSIVDTKMIESRKVATEDF